MDSLPLPSKTQLPGCSPAPVKTSLLSSHSLAPHTAKHQLQDPPHHHEALDNLTPGAWLSPPLPLPSRKPSPAPSPHCGGQSLCLHLHHPYLLELHVPHILNWRPPTASNDISWCVSVLYIPFLSLVFPHVKHLIGIISISTTGIKYWIDGLIGFCFIVVQSLLFWHVCLLRYKKKNV